MFASPTLLRSPKQVCASTSSKLSKDSWTFESFLRHSSILRIAVISRLKFLWRNQKKYLQYEPCLCTNNIHISTKASRDTLHGAACLLATHSCRHGNRLPSLPNELILKCRDRRSLDAARSERASLEHREYLHPLSLSGKMKKVTCLLNWKYEFHRSSRTPNVWPLALSSICLPLISL